MDPRFAALFLSNCKIDSNQEVFSEIVWQIVNGVDKEGANRYILQRSPFLEMECLIDYPGEAPADADNDLLCKAFSLDWAEKQKSPRVVKSHLTFKHLPDDLLEKVKKLQNWKKGKGTGGSKVTF